MMTQDGKNQSIRILKSIAFLPEVILCILVILEIILLNCSVVARYVLGTSLDWSEEWARIMFFWLSFFGAAIGVKRFGHMSVNLLFDKLGDKARYFLSLLQTLLIGCFSVFLIVQGNVTVNKLMMQKFPVMGISYKYLYLAIPVAGILMAIYATMQLWELIKTKKAFNHDELRDLDV